MKIIINTVTIGLVALLDYLARSIAQMAHGQMTAFAGGTLLASEGGLTLFLSAEKQIWRDLIMEPFVRKIWAIALIAASILPLSYAWEAARSGHWRRWDGVEFLLYSTIAMLLLGTLLIIAKLRCIKRNGVE